MAEQGGAAATGRRPGRPSRAEAERRVEQLLEVATAEFIEQGYAAATIENIAAAAGCWKQAIYQRYGDKRGLFEAVVKRLADRQPLKFPPPDGRPLKAGLQRRIRFMLTAVFQPEGQAIFKLFLRNSHHFPELARIIGAIADQSFLFPLVDYLHEQQRCGHLKPVDIHVAAQYCMDLVYGRALRIFLVDSEMTEDHVDKASAELAAVLVGGISP